MIDSKNLEFLWMIVKAVGTTNTTINTSTEMSLINFFTPFKAVQSLHDCHYTAELWTENLAIAENMWPRAQAQSIFHSSTAK